METAPKQDRRQPFCGLYHSGTTPQTSCAHPALFIPPPPPHAYRSLRHKTNSYAAVKAFNWPPEHTQQLPHSNIPLRLADSNPSVFDVDQETPTAEEFLCQGTSVRRERRHLPRKNARPFLPTTRLPNSRQGNYGDRRAGPAKDAIATTGVCAHTRQELRPRRV